MSCPNCEWSLSQAEAIETVRKLTHESWQATRRELAKAQEQLRIADFDAVVALRTERNKLRSERDALKQQNEALRAELARLRGESSSQATLRLAGGRR